MDKINGSSLRGNSMALQEIEPGEYVFRFVTMTKDGEMEAEHQYATVECF